MTMEATIIPPTSGSCASCFYGQTMFAGTIRLCRLNNPQSVSSTPIPPVGGQWTSVVEPPVPGRWPSVLDTDWCGEGIDKTSYASFSPGSTQAPAAAVPVYMAPNPNPGGTQTHLVGTAAAQSMLIRSGPGWITGITVNSVATGSASLTCYDGLDATGTVIAVIDISKSNPSPQTAAPWGFNTGFFVVISNGSAGADITIVSHSA